MNHEHEIVAQVLAAQKSSTAADRLVRQYLPFIRSETAKYIHRNPIEGQDDELSIAMLAFHEAALAYRRGRGAFLPFAATAIRNRLIDHSRREQRHTGSISLDRTNPEDEDNRSLLEQLGSGKDDMEELTERTAAQSEISDFSRVLSSYGLSLTDIADNCPRQERTLAACHQALAYAKTHPEIIRSLTETRRLPLSQLAAGSGVALKTLERHRKYMVAILLAYTNGFEIIRGHLSQIHPQKGGAPTCAIS
ncbi:MAG: RNA polymerase subunit sigma [Clostridiales bacterium]|nr:RNA polymerase subunit sigma [Clostridiales bacterium]